MADVQGRSNRKGSAASADLASFDLSTSSIFVFDQAKLNNIHTLLKKITTT